MLPCPHCGEMIPSSTLFCPHCHLAVRQKRLSKVITRLLSRPLRGAAHREPAAMQIAPLPAPPVFHGQLTKQLQGSIQQFLRQERVITMATYTLIPVILLTLTVVFGLGYLRTAIHAAKPATATHTSAPLASAPTPLPTASGSLGQVTPTAVASPSATAAPTITATKVPTKVPVATPTLTPTVVTTTPQLVLAIDTGGASIDTYQADTDFSGGTTTTTTHAIDTSLVGNATPVNVYQSARAGASFTYTFRQLTSGAHYTVILDFAEIGGATQKGQRVFNVAINDQPALTNFDILAQTGVPDKAINQSLTTTAIGGQISMTFMQVTSTGALVCGIEILTAP